MYTHTNFRTKKDLKAAVDRGTDVRVFQPGGLFNPAEADHHYTGAASVEGPHYPEPHRWYARVQVVDGVIVKVT
jgi:hypothetical protein